MDDLENILNGEEQPAPEVQEPEVAEQPTEADTAEEGQPRAPDGKFAPKGKKDDAMPASEETAKHIPIQSYQAEKQKRQELEQQIEALRREMQPKEPAAPPVSIWDDDQAWQQQFGGQVVSAAVQQATFRAKLDMSEMMVRQSDPSFSENWDAMNAFLNENPSVARQAVESAHPWDNAYRAFKNHQTMSELGATNIDDLKAKLIEQIKAEQAQQGVPQSLLPTSLADAQSSRGQNTPAPRPLTLDEVLGT